MRIYVAQSGETLLTLAKKYNIEPTELITLNPHIAITDSSIGGQSVYLPSHSATPTPSLSDTDMDAYQEIPYCPPSGLQPLHEWIPLTPLDQMAQTEYDVLIVGSGAGGGAVLWRLCEKWKDSGLKIGVVEAGGLVLPSHVNGIPTLGSIRKERYIAGHKLPYPAIENPVAFPMVKQVLALGGKTIFWGLVSPRFPPSAFAFWPVSYEEMNPYYNLAEQMMEVSSDFYDDSTAQQLLFKRLQENGFPNVIPYPYAVYTKSSKYGKVFSNPFFSSMTFFAYALNLRSFDVAINARCVRIHADKNIVTGVTVMDPALRAYHIKAKKVVLAASTLENPRLLLYSGIPGRAIGHYLTDHSFIVAAGKVSRKEFTEIPGIVGLLTPASEREPFQIQMSGGNAGTISYQQYENIPVQEDLTMSILGFGEVEPRYENKVVLDPAREDRYGVPFIKIDFSYSERDLAVISRMAATLKRFAAAAGVALQSEPGKSKICAVRPGGSIHEAGTCRMGNDPSTSVTNRFGQVHGISGLYVADNSIFPTVSGTNPVLTIVALAIRTADYIAWQQNNE
ncbi:GMC oxidoreductase [Paenibacillus sp. Soil522]|uniref:GMC oxidoreductase n=1 Tax=Paenibacillus sp. Soil522 TaxID=1736388 RepID=UPI0009D77BAE|nr:GMC oxidoreductase [Paenibacillus sp. Soil522]